MPRPFISYAREDLALATQLYDDLRARGVEPWMDRRDLIGGQNWPAAIRRAIRESSHFIAILSAHSVEKRGTVQKELKQAIEIYEEFPPDTIFVIPVRVEDVKPTHEALNNIHWVDLFPSYPDGLEELVRSLKAERAPRPGTRTAARSSSYVPERKRMPWLGIAGFAIALATVLALVFFIRSWYVPRWMDQNNCASNEHWVGMTPSTTENAFQVTAEQAKHAIFHGELRWSPVINNLRQTSVGEVLLEVDGRESVIYKWNSPATATFPFDVRVSPLLAGTSGRFKIRWRWENGTSGVCVARSALTFPST